ncbi:hypothetical protein SLS58_011192 [Diplodia intermedia]|uniref:AA9 family lytic polysaccharide monooxygenase n=1 Tax=Diplodia intermedia TaxID=856260 RepID=A0ABR3T0P8_9PEZI
MKFSTLALALAASAAVEAHTIFTTLWVDGKSAGDAVGVRMRKTPKIASFPISLGSDASACGYDGEEGNPRVVSVNDGATLSFEWRAYGSNPDKGAIDPGHKGPCAVYLKKVDSAINDTGVGDGWFKIWDEGYDEEQDLWCNQKLGGADANGVYNHKLSVNLPSGLEGGYYLARPELLALHAAAANPPDPQFYTGCAQIFLQSSGNKRPDSTVSIPGYIKSDDPGVAFNIYKEPMDLPYLTPGPAVANLVSGGASGDVSKQMSQQEGLEPKNCIMEMGGWCGYEVPSYSDEKGCWASGEDCWTQNKACWDYSDKLATGGDPWCKIWEDKCQTINDNCNAKNFDGPPNKDKDLTPSLPSMASIPMAESTTNYESSGSKATVAAVQVETDASVESPEPSYAVPTTTLLTLASSSVEAETEAEKTTTYTTAAPVVKTIYETKYITDMVYATIDAQKMKRARHYGRHGVNQA